MMNRLFIFGFVLSLLTNQLYTQCCGGGGGSPVAGDALQGVLLPNQLEININYQFIDTRNFLSGNMPDTNFLDNFHSNYLYNRIGLGLSEKLSLSLEASYWLNKTQVGLNKSDTISSKGIGDLIIFPRYNIYSKKAMPVQTEITVGMGMKIPLGTYNDSVGYLEPFSGTYYYLQKPLSVQPSSGAHDFLFSMFASRNYKHKNLFFLLNGLYIKRGWNPLGEKMGDFASVSIFAGKTIIPDLNLTWQVRAEWLDKMTLNGDILMYSYPNYEPEATGFKKLFFSPQLSYNIKGTYMFYVLADIPLYQFMNETQISSQYQFTVGFSYRFFLRKPESKIE